MAGRAALWCVIALLLVRGAADVLASEEREPVALRDRSGVVPWPDDAARAFAVEFARAYLTFSPREPNRSARRLAGFVAPELFGSVVPWLPRRGSGLVAQSAVVSAVRRLDGRRALVTVAVEVASGRWVSQRQLTVPVARDDAGGLVVYDLPSLAAPSPVADAPPVEGEPLTGPGRGELEDVLVRFFGAFLAGRDGELRYFAAPGTQLTALRVPHELVALDSVTALSGGGRSRRVLVTVRARDPRSRAVLALGYRVELVHGDRWQVADVNSTSREAR